MGWVSVEVELLSMACMPVILPLLLMATKAPDETGSSWVALKAF